MNDANALLSRRDFLKNAAAGSAALMGSLSMPAAASESQATVPTRPFGNTGINVPILSFGGSLNTSLSILVLRQAVKWGVTYRMQTDYIDLYFVHSVSSSSELTNDKKVWAARKKAEGKIRFFGFSTHSNMEACMLAASKLGWIDGIMMRYNYRTMLTDDMRRAMDACAQAGIGLTAMKSQGGGQVKTDDETELELAGKFLKQGYTDAQAKLKAVWENPNIASICTEMPNMTLLMSNVAAAMDKTGLSKRAKEMLQQYAFETRSDYCTGCTRICQTAIDADIPIGDVMRCLMYARSYGDRHRARMHFQKIPLPIRRQMAGMDYITAEQRCPQKMAIGNLMREALEELG
ncbi:MAG: aldo/keto reductase [Desulfobacterales bacterium]